MPGVIMENGGMNGTHTNHDRDGRANGAGGASNTKGKAVEADSRRGLPVKNGAGEEAMVYGNPRRLPDQKAGEPDTIPADMQQRINELPPEIIHITEGFFPLSTLLTRSAMKSQVELSEKIVELGRMPLPSSSVSVNAAQPLVADDNSPENVDKKVSLLNFAQEQHASWLKNLVLTQWARRSEDVSKIIDLRVHLMNERTKYEMAMLKMGELRKNLAYARVPNPDLKTAVEVMTTGKANWMPELGYIEPPPLKPQDIKKALLELDTLLTIRLNLHEYDKMPFHFKDFTIKSGRVTFRVPDEFELDLTIFDDNPENQFWFLDLRFLFSPRPSDLPPHIRYHLEVQMNTILATGGLSECYKFLHEFVLNQKLTELKRQAYALSVGRFAGTLKIEPLGRELCVQYWLDRYGQKGPKSYIILGIVSGKRKEGRRPHPEETSRIGLRWFREKHEVRDVEIPLDVQNLSMEGLLKGVIARHIEFILSSTEQRLSTKGLFNSRATIASLDISLTEPLDCKLMVQLTSRKFINIKIEPISGRFAVLPNTHMGRQTEWRLNSKLNPAECAHETIEYMRCSFVFEMYASKAISAGWKRSRNPGVKEEELKDKVGKETLQCCWLKRPGWTGENGAWYLVVAIGMYGEKFWLLDTRQEQTILGPVMKIVNRFELPLKNSNPRPSYAFLCRLHEFAVAMLSQWTDLRNFHGNRIPYHVQSQSTQLASRTIKVPSIFIRLSSLIGRERDRPRKLDMIRLQFRRIDVVKTKISVPAPRSASLPQQSQQSDHAGANPSTGFMEVPSEKIMVVTEARILARSAHGLRLLNERVDRDIAFNREKGNFAVRLRSQVGTTIVPELKAKVEGIERLVGFIRAVDKQKLMRIESASSSEIVFSYARDGSNSPSQKQPEQSGPTGNDDGFEDLPEPEGERYRITVKLGKADEKMGLVVKAGNPHSRLKPSLTEILNSHGVVGLANALARSIPILRMMEELEASWSPFAGKGHLRGHVHNAAHYALKYTLPLPPNSTEKKITISLRLRLRGKQEWWFVIDEKPPGQPKPDELDTKVRQLWDVNGEGWVPLRNGAGCPPSGLQSLLQRLDALLHAATVAPAAAQPQANQPQANQPVANAPKPQAAPPQAAHPAQPAPHRQQPAPTAPMMGGAPTAPMGSQHHMNQMNQMNRSNSQQMNRPNSQQMNRGNSQHQHQHPGQGQQQRPNPRGKTMSSAHEVINLD